MSEFMAAFTADQTGLFGLLFNILLIIAVGGLWLMWARHIKRQKEVESILATSSGQLEEATRHLESALNQISRLQKQHTEPQVHSHAEQVSPRASNPASSSEATKPDHPDATHASDDAAINNRQPEAFGHASRSMAAADPAQQTDVQQIIRLHHLGKPAEQIAARMHIPLARVSLLLRLHEHRSSGPESA